MSTDLFYSSNPNEWTRVEGVSIDIQKPEGQVVGESINTVALIGKCARGKTGAKRVNSPAHFLSLFGGRDAGGGGTLKGEVWKALLNRQFSWPMVVSRVVADDAVTATKTTASGAVTAVAATGSMTSAAKADYTDGKIFTISDGTHTPVIFEIDKTGNGVAGTNTVCNLSSATTANECAIILVAAINSVTTGLTVTAGTPSNGTFVLTADTSDATHNVTITTDITATGFAVSGMANGVTYAAPGDGIQVDATSEGAWANGATGYGITYDIVDATDLDATHFDFVTHFGGKSTRYKNLNTTTGQDNLASVVGTAESNLVLLTKLSDGRPINVTGASLATGSDGEVDGGSYLDALDLAANYPGIDIVAVCERAVDAAGQVMLNAEITWLAPLHPMVNFVTWGGVYGDVADDAALKVAQITTLANNIIWCTNTSRTLDAKAGDFIEGGSHLDMAALLSQTDADIHPGDEDNLKILAGINSLGNESLGRGDLITAKEAGMSTLEKVDGGFRFHTAVATDGSEVTDVRAAQFLIQSLTNAWKHDIRKPFTTDRATNMIGKGNAFCKELQDTPRIIDSDSATLGKAWKFQFVQTDEERAQNLGKLQTQIRTVPHLLYLAVLTDISTGTSTFTLTR